MHPEGAHEARPRELRGEIAVKPNDTNARGSEVRLFTQYDRGFLPLRAWKRAMHAMRTLALRLRGAHVGRKVAFGKDPEFYGVSGYSIGDGVNVGRRARLETHRTERGQAQLTIGSGTHIGNDFHAGAALRVLIGRNCMIASGCTVLDHDHDFANPFDARQSREGVLAAPTVIEDSVFLGERTTVLKGVRIGNGCVVAAHSVVTHDLPPLTMAAGAPARPIRTWNERTNRWEKVTPAPATAGATGAHR